MVGWLVGSQRSIWMPVDDAAAAVPICTLFNAMCEICEALDATHLPYAHKMARVPIVVCWSNCRKLVLTPE